MFSYYKQNFVNGDWALFREDENRRQEIYRFGAGWARSNELFVLRSKGEIDRSDRIDEQAALSLIRSIGEDPEAVSPPIDL